MLSALADTRSTLGLVLENTESEGESSGLLGDLGEDGTRGLELEGVGGRGLLVDGGARSVGGLELCGGEKMMSAELEGGR